MSIDIKGTMNSFGVEKRIPLINLFERYKTAGQTEEQFFDTQKKWFLYFAEIRVGAGNYIMGENEKAIDGLLKYFLGLDSCFDKNKSIYLFGYFGSGKSLLFTIIQEVLKRLPAHSGVNHKGSNNFLTTSIEDIVIYSNLEELIKSKLILNEKINDFEIAIRDPKHVLINEIGRDYKTKNFGTDGSEIVDLFLKKRYDLFQENKKLTHVTSNYSKDVLKGKFSPEIADRFNEMFNFVTLKGQSFRK